MVTPFLPGDSLLFVVGAFSATGAFHPFIVVAVLILAAVLGDNANYIVGKYVGKKLLTAKKVRLINKEYLDKTHRFFKKHGGKTIIFVRFIPMVRTSAPFAAGFSHIDYPKFFAYNVLGGVLWVAIFVMGSFYFGNISVVKENLSFVISIIIFISILPAVAELLRIKREGMRVNES